MHKLSRGLLFSAGLTFLGVSLISCQDQTISRPIEVPDIVRWSQPETDTVALLSEEPNECLAPSETAEMAQKIAFGRLAFRSPFLLGGQAARRGLTCQACHGQGQTNTHFFVIGLSSEAGTADVTSFHFSDELGDESFNPVPIPSLSDDFETVDFNPEKEDLDVFVTRLITKEFTGPTPTDDIQHALLTYLRALDDKFCQTPVLSAHGLMQYKSDIITESFSALIFAEQTQDTLNFMTAALRQEIGRLHDRFPSQKTLQDDLAAISQTLNAKGSNVQPSQIQKASSEWETTRKKLSKHYARSLFNPAAIKEWDYARRN